MSKKLAKRLVPGDTVVTATGRPCPVVEVSRVRHPENRHRQLVCVIYAGEDGNHYGSFFDLKTPVSILTGEELTVS